MLFSIVGFAQKSKGKTTIVKNIVLGFVDNISAEIVTEKLGKRVLIFVKKDGKIDTLEIKKIDKLDFKPSNFTIKSYTTQGKRFYHVSWKEMIKVDTKLKKENGTVSEDQLWDIESKTLLLGNIHKFSNVKETIFLDKNKTASHDVEKNRNEGFEFKLNPDGSFDLTTKTQNSTYVYNSNSLKYELKSNPKSNTTKKQK